MRIILAYMLTFFTVLAAFGNNPSDSVKVYFHIGHRQFDPSLGNNRAVMGDFVAKVREADTAGNIERIVVKGHTSPDGLNAANARLARNRAETIAAYIADHSGVSRTLVEAEPQGIAWGELRRLVAENPNVPSRERVLDILDNTPVWIFDAQGRIVDGRKKQLMDLRGGMPYRWMFDNIFPELRNAVAVCLYLRPEVEEIAVEETAPVQEVIVEETVEEEDLQSSVLSDLSDSSDQSDFQAPVVTEFEYITRPRFEVKTNLLYDAALLPNIRLECFINDRWSVSLEGDVAWWSNESSNKCYQLALVSPEVRRLLIPRGPWHGMYIGAFVGAGLYDLESGSKGYQGSGAMAGVSVGYKWPLGKHLWMEAAVGAGYLYTRYKQYRPQDGHYIYELTRSTNYIGPLKLELSLAWRFNEVIKRTKTTTVL